MRTGVLSDEYIRKKGAPELFPLDARTHDNVYGQLDLCNCNNLTHKQRLFRHRRIVRPRAPYMHHHEVARMMNPLNVQAPHEAFGDQLQAVVNSQPSRTFNQIKEEYNVAYPDFSTDRGTLPEVAVYLHKLEINPANYFQQGNQHGIFVSKKKMKRTTLQQVHERLHADLVGSQDPARILEINDAYQSTLDQLMTPQQKFEEIEKPYHETP